MHQIKQVNSELGNIWDRGSIKFDFVTNQGYLMCEDNNFLTYTSYNKEKTLK